MHPRTHRALALLVGFTASIAVVACDAPDEPTEEAAPAVIDSLQLASDMAPIKACDVATEAELEAVLGTDLEAARTTTDYGGVSQCRWNLPGDATRGVSISLREQGTLDDYHAIPGAETVSGVGDEAVWTEAYSQLAVRTGERVLSVALFVEGARREDAVGLARAAIERIDQAVAEAEATPAGS